MDRYNIIQVCFVASWLKKKRKKQLQSFRLDVAFWYTGKTAVHDCKLSIHQSVHSYLHSVNHIQKRLKVSFPNQSKTKRPTLICHFSYEPNPATRWRPQTHRVEPFAGTLFTEVAVRESAPPPRGSWQHGNYLWNFNKQQERMRWSYSPFYKKKVTWRGRLFVQIMWHCRVHVCVCVSTLPVGSNDFLHLLGSPGGQDLHQDLLVCSCPLGVTKGTTPPACCVLHGKILFVCCLCVAQFEQRTLMASRRDFTS